MQITSDFIPASGMARKELRTISRLNCGPSSFCLPGVAGLCIGAEPIGEYSVRRSVLHLF